VIPDTQSRQHIGATGTEIVNWMGREIGKPGEDNATLLNVPHEFLKMYLAIANRKVAANQSQTMNLIRATSLKVLENRVTQEEHFALKLAGEIYSSPY